MFRRAERRCVLRAEHAPGSASTPTQQAYSATRAPPTKLSRSRLGRMPVQRLRRLCGEGGAASVARRRGQRAGWLRGRFDEDSYGLCGRQRACCCCYLRVPSTGRRARPACGVVQA